MRHNICVDALVAVAAMVCVACEQVSVDVPAADRPANVHLRIAAAAAFDDGATRAAEPADAWCSRIDVAVYDSTARIVGMQQRSDEAGFGCVDLALPAGSYYVVILGHSSEAAATTTDAGRITFRNNIVTDTFIYADSITIADEAVEEDVILCRCVAKVMFCLPEPLPSDIHAVRFYYTGGSSTLSALTGYGSVNSRQTVVVDNVGQTTYELYTFPHSYTGTLKLTVTALAADGTSMQTLVPRLVAVQQNCISRFATSLFGEDPQAAAACSATVMCDPEWTDTYDYTW